MCCTQTFIYEVCRYENSTNSTNHEQGLKLALMSSINVAVLRPLKVGWPGSHAEMYMESPLESQPVASGCQWRGGIFLWMIHSHSAKTRTGHGKSHHVDDIYQEKIGIYTKNWPYLKVGSFFRLFHTLGILGILFELDFPGCWRITTRILIFLGHICVENYLLTQPYTIIHTHFGSFWPIFFDRPPFCLTHPFFPQRTRVHHSTGRVSPTVACTLQ